MDDKLNQDLKEALPEVKNIQGGNLIKLIFIFLAIVVILELLWVGRVLFTPTKKSKPDHIQQLGSGSIILVSDKASYQTDEIIPVQIKLSTGGREADSIDIILRFDPKILEASNSSFEKGELYKDYPLIDISQNLGIIKISAVALPDTYGFNGVGIFGKINFRAQTGGQTKIITDFKKGSTTDSNLIEAGTTKDILKEVFDLDLAIGENPITEQRGGLKVCGGYKQYCQDISGRIGMQFCQGGVLQNEVCIFDPILTESCTSCSFIIAK